MKIWPFGSRIIQITAILIFASLPASAAEMEWQIDKQFNLKSPALDMALSQDGKWIYLLDENGDLNIYDMKGALEGKIPVGKGYNRILPGAEPDSVLLSNQQEQLVENLTITFVHDINIEGSPFKGPENAPVIISLFTDFQCPYCAKLVPILEEVLESFPKEVKLVYKNFPLRSHTYAVDAAKAAMAAHNMGNFWEFHDLLFKNYNQLNREKIDAIRAELKLDKKSFDQHVNDPKTLAMIRNDYRVGIDVGVRGTPSLFINGKQFKDRNPKALK